MGITSRKVIGLTIATLAMTALTACDESGRFNLADRLNLRGQNAGATETAPAGGRTVEQDVEAPEVFSVTEEGLWDGRPSLGGVWVAHPDVSEPERVIIRNPSNGKFVVGALFRRERDIPGPRLQISSDAATALGVVAGAPQELNVTALRRKEVPVDEPVAEESDSVPAPADVTETALDPVASAGAAIESAPVTDPGDDASEVADNPAPRQTLTATPASALEKPYLQVGIFNVEANADHAARQMRSAGMLPTVREGGTGETPFWRVIVGPAGTTSERSALLQKIKAEGFSDAYPVTN